MPTSPAPSSPLRRVARFLPSGRAWWLVAGAFLAGLVLFALVLSGKRDEFEFFRADAEGAAVDASGQVFEPLPAPLPAGESAASGMDGSAPQGSTRIDQHAAPPEVADAAAPPAPAAAAGPGDASLPRPLSTPAPDYPRAALRAGASGEVVLRIEVRANGRPGDVEVIGSSRNRELDRAAVRAVRRWRFEPALREGVPVPATVQQVISFDAPR